jgi:mannosidase alpha-like ER degradation enhancer 2
MKIIALFSAAALLLSQGRAAGAGSAPKPAPVSAPLSSPVDRAEMAARVRAEFLSSWQAYERYAWGHDELKPLSKTPRDWYGEPLLMTPVDSLDSLLLLGFKDEAAKAQALIVDKLSFDKDIPVKNFEVTIRLLGGLLSGYQMTGDARLLHLAEDLGRRLLPVFNSPTGMPYMYVNLRTGKTSGARSNPAEIGTLLLEFGTLSKLTKNPVFYDKAKNAVVQLYKRRSKIGLVGEEIDVETGEWTSTASHVGGGIDSYYEYLLKCSRLFGDKDCGKMWKESLRALDKHLADQAPTGLWYGQVDMATGKRTATEFGALHAFLPAVLALGGDLGRAKRLQDSAYKMWNLAGIEPEVIDYRTMKITAAGYPLRPEIMESAYYLFHDTRDPKYLEMGRTFFEALVAHCRTNDGKTSDGYTVLKDVTTWEKGDLMPSYFLAETLKYLYLLFAPEKTLDLEKVVFNTEAHPLRRSW